MCVSNKNLHHLIELIALQDNETFKELLQYIRRNNYFLVGLRLALVFVRGWIDFWLRVLVELMASRVAGRGDAELEPRTRFFPCFVTASSCSFSANATSRSASL